jgi:predicted HicB family RNase H-like nuclease
MPVAKTKVVKLKRGRPPKPKGEVLGEPTPIRFQEGELKQYEREARAEGLTLSEWVRKTLNQAVNR